VTDDVPEGATMVGIKARSTLIPAEQWVKDFIPYGTPCEDAEGNRVDCIEKLESELTALRAEIAAIRAESRGEPVEAARDLPKKSGTKR
jgi:serine O-acetyltransferase